ncbi:MAG: hypothetical protein ABFD79_10075 [Phycisphaerales bacterium]
MRFFNWAKAFEEQPTCEDILKKVTKTEITYWIFLIISVFITLDGLSMILNANDSQIRKLFLGLFLAVVGVVNIALMKIWAHIRLTTYLIIWDRKNRIEGEIRKSEAADL